MARFGAVLAVSTALALLAGCSHDADRDADADSDAPATGPCTSASSAPAAETALLPPGLSLAKVGTLTHVTRGQGRFTAQAVSTRPLDELTVAVQDAVTAAGYRPAGMDSEEDEAEVFFTSGTQAAGQARVRQGACDGQWTVELDLIDPEK
jgi:hypothetical protein